MYCGSVKVVCEYNGSIVDVYEILESFGSVIVICEYNGSVVDVYGDELNKERCGCRKELWVESRREEGIR